MSRGAAIYDPSDWAWEFLRRNPEYRAAWRASVPRRSPYVTLKDGTALLRLRRRYPKAERWRLTDLSKIVEMQRNQIGKDTRLLVRSGASDWSASID